MSVSKKLWDIVTDKRMIEILNKEDSSIMEQRDFTDYNATGHTKLNINSDDYKVVQKGKKVYIIKLKTPKGRSVFKTDKDLQTYIKNHCKG